MLGRDITFIANYILDNWVPPILRDCKWFMRPIIRIAYGSCTDAVMAFKDKFPFMDESELSAYYELIKDSPINRRESDLNKKCLNYLLENVLGCNASSVLDVACGGGGLLKKIKEKYPGIYCHGSDIVLPDTDIPMTQASLSEALPFESSSFDIVLCTHALEHIRSPKKAIAELIRIAKKRIILVVPQQREYKYTPDLHVHFLPYMYSFKAFIGIKEAQYLKLKGDFVCVIDKSGVNNCYRDNSIQEREKEEKKKKLSTGR